MSRAHSKRSLPFTPRNELRNSPYYCTFYACSHFRDISIRFCGGVNFSHWTLPAQWSPKKEQPSATCTLESLQMDRCEYLYVDKPKLKDFLWCIISALATRLWRFQRVLARLQHRDVNWGAFHIYQIPPVTLRGRRVLFCMANSTEFLHSIDRFLRSDGECLNREDDIACSALTIIFQHPENSWYDPIGNSNALTLFAL